MGLLDTLVATAPSLMWQMDHASGAPKDVSGHGRNATNTFGTVTPRYAPSAPGLVGARTPQSGAAVSNGYGIAVGSLDSWALGQALSGAVWGVLNSTPTFPSMIFGRRKGGTPIGASQMYFNTNRSVKLYFLDQSSGTHENYCGLQTSAGVNWLWPLGLPTMVGFTLDTSNNLIMYVNGVQMGFDFYSDSATHVGYVTTAVCGHRNNGGDYFMAGGGGQDTFGTPDFTYGPVVTWNRVLTAAEMSKLYVEGVRGGVNLGMGGYGG